MPVRPLPAALLVAALAGGCRGSASTDEGPTPGPTSPSAAAPSLSVSPSPAPVSKHGGAEITHRGMSYAWAERGCETTRDRAGKVVGLLLTFQDPAEQALPFRPGVGESRSFVQIRVRGWTGPGAYPSERLSVRLHATGAPYVTGFGAAGQSLVMDDEGHAGTYESGTTTVEFTCDPSDDTSTDPGEPIPATPAAGTAYVVRAEGAVFAFDDVSCSTSGMRTTVTAGEFPHYLRVVAGGGAPRVQVVLHGVVIPFSAGAAKVEVVGGSGSFRAAPSGAHAGADAVRGAFTCG